MHLTAIVESYDHVCCRYRVRPLESMISVVGGRIDYRSAGPSFFARSFSRESVLVQRRLLGRWPLTILRRRCRRLLFDFDDAIWLRDSYSPRGLTSNRRLRRFRSMIRAADHVVAGNRFLAEQAARFTSPDRVRVIPTCVDPSRYRPARHQREGRPPRFAWIGSSSTLQGLERITHILDALGRACPGARLVLICDRTIQLSELQVEFHPWSPTTEAKILASADIGISWLPDDDWSRGKCGLKLLQFMAAGLPVLANPVGVQREIVGDGETGYHCDSPHDWIEATRRLMRDPSLRRRMGETGRQLVERHFSIDAMHAAWRTLLLDPQAVTERTAA